MSLTQQNNARFYELDLMRFLAALAVLFYHYTFSAPALIHTPSFGIDIVSRYGYLGVDAFFMISGYVVLMSSMHKSPKYFIISRVVRLYPSYWVCCLFTFLFLYFGKISSPQIPVVTIKLLIYNITMFQEFFGKANLNGVFWTLSYELGFYIIILFIAIFKLWKHLLMILGIWLIYTFYADYLAAKNAFSFFLIPKYSACFIAGMLFYLLRIKFSKRWRIYLLIIFCIIVNIKNNIVITNEMNHFYHASNIFNKYVIFAFTITIYGIFMLSALKKFDVKILSYPAKLGALTYPLYLMHSFGIGIFMVLGGKIDKYVILLIATLLSIVVSFLIYKFIEEKGRPILKSSLIKLSNKM